MKKILISVLFVTLSGLLAACPSPPPDNSKVAANTDSDAKELLVKTAVPDYQWVQLGDGGAVIARAVFKPGRADLSEHRDDRQRRNKSVRRNADAPDAEYAAGFRRDGLRGGDHGRG